MNISPLAAFFLVFVILVVIRMPMFMCLMGSAVIYIIMSPQLNMLTAMTKLMAGPNSYTLLAVPFFILAAQLMNNGGVTDRIFGFCKVLLGHLPGGLAYVNVAASLIFSGISGSALADVGGLGQLEIKAMRDEGYDDDLTIGITAASSTVGPIIPPSIPFIIYASMAGVSVGAMFMGGIGPGILCSIVLCIYIYMLTKKRHYKAHEKASGREIWDSFKNAFAALMFPVIMLGSIWSGVVTPTEAAMIAVLYGLFVSIFLYKDIKLQQLPEIIIGALEQAGPSMACVISAGVFAWVLTYEKIDSVAVSLILSITQNKFVILLLLNVLLLFLGMFVEVTAAIMITLPILTPLIAIAGINPVHMGIILVFNMMIGLLTPPVGFSLYMLTSVANRKFDDIVKMVTPWLIPLFIVLALITYFEPFVMGLPRLLGLV